VLDGFTVDDAVETPRHDANRHNCPTDRYGNSGDEMGRNGIPRLGPGCGRGMSLNLSPEHSSLVSFPSVGYFMPVLGI